MTGERDAINPAADHAKISLFADLLMEQFGGDEVSFGITRSFAEYLAKCWLPLLFRPNPRQYRLEFDVAALDEVLGKLPRSELERFLSSLSGDSDNPPFNVIIHNLMPAPSAGGIDRITLGFDLTIGS